MSDSEILQTLSRKYANIIPNEIMEYFIEAFTDLNITVSNIQEKSMLVSTYRAKWIAIQFAERMKLTKLERMLEKYRQNKVAIHKAENEQTRHMPNVIIEDQLFANDPQHDKLTDSIELQKQLIDFLNPIIQIFTNHGFSVKTALDSLKLTMMS